MRSRIFRQALMKQGSVFAIALGLVNSLTTWAERSSFHNPNSGVVVGVGTYFHPLAHDNAFDPVPALAPAGTTVSGSNGARLLPLKIGFFREFPGTLFVEMYGRYIMNLSHTWTTQGGFNGTGNTTWSSYGGGGNLGFGLKTWEHFRFQVVANGEYILQKALISLQSTEGGPEELNVRVTSILAGGGLRFEMGALDAWNLSLYGGYQYGMSSYWSAASSGTLFGSVHSGTLQNAQDGNSILAQHGGVLVEAALKLNFY